ncbi:MAG TPA: M28 family metallopeptidase [Candidatus Krumholzibacteria bacterium]|nr:M28 family metallopeptidase [Candidatus Krumholzibacteria bacterium]
MKRLIPTLSIVLAATALASSSHSSGDARTRGLNTITSDDIAAHVRVLASDEYEGRMPATRGEEKTLAYITERFRSFGISPQPNASYLQEVPLVKKSIDAEATRLVVAGQGKETTLVLGENMTAKTGGAVERVTVARSELVFGGFGIVAEDLGWNDYAGVDVTGKTVVLLIQDPRGAADSLYFKGRALSHYGTGIHKSETAARKGARGVIFIHDQDAIGYPFAAIAANAKRPSFERVRGPESAPIPEFTATISKDLAAEMFASAGQDLATLTEAASRKGFRARPVGLSLSGEIATELEYSTSHNVVGYIPGRDRPDEFVVYTAHWDHVGIGAAVDGDSIYNGAVDNATGTAALLELAQAYRALPDAPSRSVVFIATAAEEQGLLGAYHYADHPVFPLANTIAVINMDALFPFGEFNGMTVVALGSSELEEYMEAAASELGRKLQTDPSPEFGAFFRSDHYPFAKKGVPAIFAVGGPLDTPEPSAEMLERFNTYMSAGYHHPEDEYRDDWDLSGVTGDVKIYFLTGYAIANDTRVPNWYPDSEFRALRDRQREAR